MWCRLAAKTVDDRFRGMLPRTVTVLLSAWHGSMQRTGVKALRWMTLVLGVTLAMRAGSMQPFGCLAKVWLLVMTALLVVCVVVIVVLQWVIEVWLTNGFTSADGLSGLLTWFLIR